MLKLVSLACAGRKMTDRDFLQGQTELISQATGLDFYKNVILALAQGDGDKNRGACRAVRPGYRLD